MAGEGKTNRSLKKRFKITGTGKLKHSNTSTNAMTLNAEADARRMDS